MRTILVVDDDPLTLEAVRRPLARAGYQVTALGGGEAALAWLEQSRPDVVILDVVMPDLSGYEVCRRLRALPEMETLPVIFLTSKDQVADAAEARAAGSSLFVTKPVLAERLLKMLKDLPPRPPAVGTTR